MVSQHEVLVNRESKSVTDVRHDFGLLDRINPQFTLEVLVEFDEISGVARVFNDDRHDRVRHLGVVNHRHESGCSRRNLSDCRRRWFCLWCGFCRRGRLWGSTCHALDVADHVIERRVIGQDEIFVHRETEAVTDVGHDFGLLDRINTKFAFEVLVQFNEVRWVTGVVHHHLNDG